MSRRLLAATAIALLATLLPLARTFGQVRVMGVLQGSLVLLSVPSSSADVAPLRMASIASAPDTHVLPGGRTFGFSGSFAEPLPQRTDTVAPPAVRRVVRATDESLAVWAPGAQRIELRLEDDGAASRTVDCQRERPEADTPATCNAGESLPAHATLTIYLRSDGSR